MISFNWFYDILIIIYLILLLTLCRADNKLLQKSNLYSSNVIKKNTEIKTYRNEIMKCFENNSNKKENNFTNKIITTWSNCLKVTTLKIFDDILSSSEINLMDGVKLVKISKESIKMTSNNLSSLSAPSKSNNFKKNDTANLLNIDMKPKNIYVTKDIWTYILHKFMEVMRNYSLHVKFKNTNIKETGRHRRRNNMMMAMMFGITAMGAIIVPVGFQLLSAISGKALLLAKMALLLASLNGLKKIASSGLNYGLYQVSDHPHSGVSYYDRTDPIKHQNII